MWPSNLVLPKMNMTKVTGPLNSDKNRVETSRTVNTGRTDSSRNSQSARPDSARTLNVMEKFGSLGVDTDMPLPEIAPVVTAIPETVTVVPPKIRRNIKKSREERYSSDMQDNENKVILPSISSYSEATTENVTSSATSLTPMAVESNVPTSSTPTPRTPLTKIDSKLSDISQVKFLCKGSHSRVFKGVYQNKTIVIKVLADSSVNKSIAQMEFKLEKDILSRINHTNILNIIGCGEVSSKLYPSGKRPLMILEALTGGTLAYHLNKHKQQLAIVNSAQTNEEMMNFKAGIAMSPSPPSSSHNNNNSNNNHPHHPSMVHSIMPFTELQFIRMAKQFADALHYLHEKFGPNITLIHRDLKPDNIGFSDDGVLKLMDFGLSTTVKKNASESDVYELSGCTGSYRYMAPEVALNKSYNEKVDVYSYGLILYEMLTGVTPFQEDCKETFYIKVVYGHERPSFDEDEFHNPITTLPALKLSSVEVEDGFHLKRMKSFIELCWHPVYTKRPTAQEALVLFTELENILLHGCHNNNTHHHAHYHGRAMMRCSSGSELDTVTSINASYNSQDHNRDCGNGTGGGNNGTYSDDDTVARETKKNRIVKNYSSSMLASRGEYSWTKESVNAGASNGNNSGNNSHDNSMDHERNIYENSSSTNCNCSNNNGSIGMTSSQEEGGVQGGGGNVFKSSSASSSSSSSSSAASVNQYNDTTAQLSGGNGGYNTTNTTTVGNYYYSMGIACTTGCATNTTATVTTNNNAITAMLPPVPQTQSQQHSYLLSSPPPTPQKYQLQQNNQNTTNNGNNTPTNSNNYYYYNSYNINNANNNNNNYQKTPQQLQNEKEAYLKHTMSTSSCYSVNSNGDLVRTNNNDADSNSSVNSAVNDGNNDNDGNDYCNINNNNNIRKSSMNDEQMMVMMNEKDSIPLTSNNNNNANTNNYNNNNYDDKMGVIMMQTSSPSLPITDNNNNNSSSTNMFRRGYESLVKQFAKPY